MARPTRQQRRARRAQATASASAAASGQTRSLQYERVQPEHKREGVLRRFGPFRFIGESAGELKKTDWPNRQQVIQGTVVVIIACAIVGGYLFAADLVIKRLVQTVLLGQ